MQTSWDIFLSMHNFNISCVAEYGTKNIMQYKFVQLAPDSHNLQIEAKLAHKNMIYELVCVYWSNNGPKIFKRHCMQKEGKKQAGR